MKAYLETSPGQFSVWKGEPINDVSHARNIVDVWTNEELADIGLFRPADADTVPKGKRSTGMSVQRVEGVVKYVHTLEDAPLEDSRVYFLREIHRHVQLTGAAFLEDYPELEQKSFSKKEAEAQLIVDGELDPAKFPTISQEIALSGRTAMEAAVRIQAKAALLSPVAGALSGFRQNAEDGIEAADSHAKMEAAFEASKALLSASIAAIVSG